MNAYEENAYEDGSIYKNGSSDWELANELLQADTDKELEAFAMKHPSMLNEFQYFSREDEAIHVPIFEQSEKYQHLSKTAHKPLVTKYDPLTLTDYKAMQALLLSMLDIKEAIDNPAKQNCQGLESLGIKIESSANGSYWVNFGLALNKNEDKRTYNLGRFTCEECLYITLINFDYFVFDCPFPRLITLDEQEQNLYKEALFTVFDSVVNLHLRKSAICCDRGKLRIPVFPHSIESLWLGVLEKANNPNAHMGICKNCGKPFFAEKNRGKPRKFCDNNDKCKIAFNNRLMIQRRREQQNDANKK